MAEPEDSLLMMEPRSTEEVDASPMPSAEASPQDDDVDAQLLAVASADGGSHLYNMDHTRRGLFIIINNKTFQKCTRVGERKGTDADAANLYKTFKGLGFDVEILMNLTCSQMLEKMTKVAQYDFTDSDCFACAILSHGDAGMVYGIDGIIEIDSLVAPFKGDRCGSLAGKPKMFFIQACRGTQPDPGVYAVDGPAKPQRVYRIPTNADFLFAYSTAPDAGNPIRYQIGEFLGSGAYGEVFRCTRDDIKDDLAVKRVKVAGVPRYSPEMGKLEGEIKMFKEHVHARIIKYYGSSWNEMTFDIFLEYMPGGSIRKQLTTKGRFDEGRTKKYTYQALEGLAYLHEKKIIHRDLKGDNILLDATATNIKLSDFGTAKQLVSITLSNGGTSCVGTPHWMSPELLRGEYGRRTDIWSLGCTVVEMLTTNPPWHTIGPQAAIFKIGNLRESEQPVYDLPPETSDEARNFINLCFEVDAKKRKSAVELMLEAFCKQECE